MARKNTRLNRQDTRQAQQLEEVRAVLAVQGLNPRRRKVLEEKEKKKISAHFQQQDAELDNALDGLSL
jgi:hypothetical protein